MTPPRVSETWPTPASRQADGRAPLFPINGHVPVPEGLHRLSRGTRQRLSRAARAADDHNACVNAINWCADGVCGDLLPDAGRLHRELQDRVSQRVAERGRPDVHETEEEAARALLRAHVAYDEGGSQVKPFTSACNVSLPSSIEGAPQVLEVLNADDRALLKNFEYDAEGCRGVAPVS